MAPRYASKTDANHAAIRDGLRSLGADAIDTFRLGDGKPDLIVIWLSFLSGNVEMTWWEIKADGGGLTGREQAWHRDHGARPIGVARCIDDILEWYGRNG